MKSIRATLFLCVCMTLSVFSQEEELLLSIDEPWRSERLDFPISFAPSLDYKGIEEVRFAKGWGDIESDEFWTYTFLWYLDEDPMVTENKLATDMESYFNGLLTAVGKSRGMTDIPESNAIFIDVPEIKNEQINTRTSYHGKVKIFDVFFSKSIQTLNVRVVSDYCTLKKKYTVLFTFSPQERDHTIWKTLNTIQLSHACE